MDNSEGVDFPRKLQIAFQAFQGLLNPMKMLTYLKLVGDAIGSLSPFPSHASAPSGSLPSSGPAALSRFSQVLGLGHQVPRRPQSILLAVGCDFADLLPSLPPSLRVESMQPTY